MAYKLFTASTFINYVQTLVAQIILLVGIGALLSSWVYVNNFQQSYQESILFSIELKTDAGEAEVFSYQKKLEVSLFVKPNTVEYLSKEDGIKLLGEQLNTEELLLFGENPLPNILRFQLRASYLTQAEEILAEIRQQSFVKEILYTEDIVEKASSSTYWWGFLVIFLVIFFIFAQLTLVANFLKLNILKFQKKLRLLQLVGASKMQIYRPFWKQCVRTGASVAVITIFIWWLLLSFVENNIEGLSNFNNSFISFCILCVLVLISVGTWWYLAHTQTHKNWLDPLKKDN